jgi:uncharacterized protein
MPETVRMAQQLHLASVHFEPVSLTGRSQTDSIERPDAAEFAERFLACFLEGLKRDVDVHYSGLRCFSPCNEHFCAACGQNFCVTPDGNVTTCYEVLDSCDPASQEFFIGKVDSTRRCVLIDHARIERLRQRVTRKMDACEGCFLRHQCAGDCPVKSFRYSGNDLYSPDPYRCQIARRINAQLIAWVADGEIEARNATQATVFSFDSSCIAEGGVG